MDAGTAFAYVVAVTVARHFPHSIFAAVVYHDIYLITSPIKSNEVQKISADFRVQAAKLNKITKVDIVAVTLTLWIEFRYRSGGQGQQLCQLWGFMQFCSIIFKISHIDRKLVVCETP